MNWKKDYTGAETLKINSYEISIHNHVAYDKDTLFVSILDRSSLANERVELKSKGKATKNINVSEEAKKEAIEVFKNKLIESKDKIDDALKMIGGNDNE